jgi:hypothetical protein
MQKINEVLMGNGYADEDASTCLSGRPPRKDLDSLPFICILEYSAADFFNPGPITIQFSKLRITRVMAEA